MDINIFIFIGYALEISLEVVACDDDGAAAVIGVEREGVGIAYAAIEEEMYMVFGVVDKSERRDAAWFEPQVFEHALWRCE